MAIEFKVKLPDEPGSLARLAAFEERDDATIIVNHDPEQWASLRVAPEGEYT